MDNICCNIKRMHLSKIFSVWEGIDVNEKLYVIKLATLFFFM